MFTQQATMQGTMHKDFRVPNQDAVASEIIEGHVCAVVCDGVSMKTDYTFSQSEIASHFCTRYILKYLRENLKEDMDVQGQSILINAAFQACNLALNTYLEELSIPYWDCQTTVLCSIYQDGKVAYGIAGDGGILIEAGEDTVEFAVSAIKTSSTVHPIADVAEWKIGVFDDPENPVHILLMATDGVFDAILGFKGQRPYVDGQLIGQLFAVEEEPEEQREAYWQNVIRNVQSHDDKTAFILVDREPEA